MTIPPAFPRPLATVLLAFALSACGSDDAVDGPQSATFGETPVAGLDVAGTSTTARRTDASGRFQHAPGETMRFSVGALALGSAPGAAVVTARDVTGGAAVSDRRVTNKLILLQTLDVDGNLNNGIEITDAIRTAVSDRAASIDFDQETAAFRTSLAPLLSALNTAGLFTDLDPRPRIARV